MDPKGIEPFMNIGAQSSYMILLTYLILLKGPITIPSTKILHISLLQPDSSASKPHRIAFGQGGFEEKFFTEALHESNLVKKAVASLE